MMRNRMRRQRRNDRPRRYGKWLVIGLLLAAIAGLGKRSGDSRRPNRSVDAA